MARINSSQHPLNLKHWNRLYVMIQISKTLQGGSMEYVLEYCFGDGRLRFGFGPSSFLENNPTSGWRSEWRLMAYIYCFSWDLSLVNLLFKLDSGLSSMVRNRSLQLGKQVSITVVKSLIHLGMMDDHLTFDSRSFVWWNHRFGHQWVRTRKIRL